MYVHVGKKLPTILRLSGGTGSLRPEPKCEDRTINTVKILVMKINFLTNFRTQPVKG